MRTATKSKAPKARRQQAAKKPKQPSVQQPADLYFAMVSETLGAENEILTALPQIIELAGNEELKASLSNHQKETEGQRDRLKQIVGMMNRQEQAAGSPSMKSLLQDGQKKAQRVQEGFLRDLAIIAACTKVEYFEMSSYRSLMSMAEKTNFDSHIDLLEETFNEEKQAAQILTRLASQMDLPEMQGEQKEGGQQSTNPMQSLPQGEAVNQKETISMRGSERERDSQGRFMSDDDDRGGRRDYNRGGGGGRGRNDDDDDRPGWRGDPQGHSEAARKGWETREREGRGGGRGGGDYDDDRGGRGDYNRGGGRGRNDDDDGRGWYGDPRGHSEAAREGWRNREGGGGRGRSYDDDRDYSRGRGRDDDNEGRGWFGDPRGHSEAAREGWRTREREGNDTYDEGNRPGWYGDPRGHSEAAREGWRDREGSRGGRDYDYNRGGGGGRGRNDDDDDRPGWRGDPRGHSEAARKGWETRERGGGRGGSDYDDDRGSSNRGGGRGRNDDDDDRGWYGDPRGHSEAARKGWQNRDR